MNNAPLSLSDLILTTFATDDVSGDDVHGFSGTSDPTMSTDPDFDCCQNTLVGCTTDPGSCPKSSITGKPSVCCPY